MAEPDQSEKETVRIELPMPPSTKAPDQSVKSRETVRIQLPVRETGNPPVPASPDSAPDSVSSVGFFPSPKAPTASPLSFGSERSASFPASSTPKRETVRIPLAQEPVQSPQKKTQLLTGLPKVVPQNLPSAAAPAEKKSMLPYWMLLAASVLILIIQIWTYFS